MKDEHGQNVKDEQGRTIMIPGSLKSVKAMGILLEAHNIAQVSINLTDFEQTPPHRVFEEVRHEAQKLGVKVTGSEIVGLTPKKALVMAGRYYTNDETKTEEQLISIAIEALGLRQFEQFDPEKKIIEFQL
jgi:glutamate formiminotransferase/formiminotetrahydrofolate cyclodeaminase